MIMTLFRIDSAHYFGREFPESHAAHKWFSITAFGMRPVYYRGARIFLGTCSEGQSTPWVVIMLPNLNLIRPQPPLIRPQPPLIRSQPPLIRPQPPESTFTLHMLKILFGSLTCFHLFPDPSMVEYMSK